MTNCTRMTTLKHTGTLHELYNDESAEHTELVKYTIYAYLARSLVIWPFIPKSGQTFNLSRDDPMNPDKTAKFDDIQCTFDDEGKLLSYDTSQSIEDTVATLFQAVDKPLNRNPYFMQRVEEVKTGKRMSPDEAEAFRKNFCWTLRHPRGPRKIFTLKEDIPRWSTYLKVHVDRDHGKEELAYVVVFITFCAHQTQVTYTHTHTTDTGLLSR